MSTATATFSASSVGTLEKMLLDLVEMARVDKVKDGTDVIRHLSAREFVVVSRAKRDSTRTINWGVCTLVVMYQWRTITRLNFTTMVGERILYEYLLNPTTGGAFCAERKISDHRRGGLGLTPIWGVPQEVVDALPIAIRDRSRLRETAHPIVWR